MSSETLYRHTIGSGGSKIRVALNLGQSLVEKGDYAKAEPLLRKIFEVNPEYPPARNALAQLLSLQGTRRKPKRS
jgi:Flp pilus assembly protein TadD